MSIWGRQLGQWNATALLGYEPSGADDGEPSEWEAGERRYVSEASMLPLKTINAPDEPLDEAAIHPELTPAEPSPLTRTVFEELHHGRGVT